MVFKTKFFDVKQSLKVFKVTTDSLLLGAWIKVNNYKQALDIGCGTGILSLMVAQKSKANILAIDVNLEAVSLANENFRNSTFLDNLIATNENYKYFKGGKFDLIFSNPPYFADSKKNIQKELSLARHQTNFDYTSFFKFSTNHLTSSGKLNLVIPFSISQNVIIKATSLGLFLSRQTFVKHHLEADYSITLLEFSKHPIPRESSYLQLYEADLKTRTIEFQKLIGNYLK